MVNTIVHFEIPADDVKRAINFYEKTLGWKIEKFEGMDYYSVYTKDKRDGPGIDGGLMKRTLPSQNFMNYVSVDSIEDTHKKIIAAGGKILMQKTEIAPNMGWISSFEDTEKNIIGLHEAPENMEN